MIAGGLDLVDLEHVEHEVAVELEVAVEVDHVGLIWKVIWMVNYVDVIEVDFG